MDQNLINLIHKYTEDREIDWIAAKIIGEQQGLEFKSENDLLKWKNTVDKYLKTFEANDFQSIENFISEAKKSGKKSGKKTDVQLGSDEGYEEYGDGGFEKRKKSVVKAKKEKSKDNDQYSLKKQFANMRKQKRS